MAEFPPTAPIAALTVEDIDQIVDGIEHFIMDGDPDVDAIWQPYVDKLRAQRLLLAAAPKLLDALERIAEDAEPCGCEHDDENCCALDPDYCCSMCIAAVALKKAGHR